jgi:NAD(P)-dependent dehydrogenase (short-subunit alcohol dehydrogenase family)
VNRGPARDSAPLAGRVALVTGASRGLGAAVAIELARRGAHVVATARTQGGLEETDDAIRAAGGACTLLPLDLKQGDSVDRIGPSIFQSLGRLDILCHVAGELGALTPVAHIQPRDWDNAFAVNVTAAWRLIRTADPLLRASDAGRAVFVTTGRTQRPKAFWGAYGASKAALEHLVATWAQELAETPVRVALFDPGIVRTKMRAMAMPGEDPATLPPPEDVAPGIADLCAPQAAPASLRISAGS